MVNFKKYLDLTSSRIPAHEMKTIVVVHIFLYKKTIFWAEAEIFLNASRII